MSKPEVEVTIDESGNVKFDVVGGSGASCKKLTEAMEKAMGVVASVEKKPEYNHAVSTGGQKVKQG